MRRGSGNARSLLSIDFGCTRFNRLDGDGIAAACWSARLSVLPRTLSRHAGRLSRYACSCREAIAGPRARPCHCRRGRRARRGAGRVIASMPAGQGSVRSGSRCLFGSSCWGRAPRSMWPTGIKSSTGIGLRLFWAGWRCGGEEIRGIEIILAGYPGQSEQGVPPSVSQCSTHQMPSGGIGDGADRPVRGNPFTEACARRVVRLTIPAV